MLERVGAGNLLAVLLTVLAVYFAREPAHVCQYPYQYEILMTCEGSEESVVRLRTEFLRCAREDGLDAHIAPIRYRWGERTGATRAWVAAPSHDIPSCIEQHRCYSVGVTFLQIAGVSMFESAELEHDERLED